MEDLRINKQFKRTNIETIYMLLCNKELGGNKYDWNYYKNSFWGNTYGTPIKDLQKIFSIRIALFMIIRGLDIEKSYEYLVENNILISEDFKRIFEKDDRIIWNEKEFLYQKEFLGNN